MLRKIFILMLMGSLIAGAASAGTSFPVLLLMGCLLLIALSDISVRSD